ncbi:MAG: wax ester/triacylglycerol synthase family O-acyltransferase [Deltaproteobacteria bacterium]|nr:wax ester/triacylglycerol synthase family O-acyltransferase [Deltaproteobacteria bacterium]
MSEGVQFDNRMSDADALMWHIERDPLLRSTITVVWVLDRAPDRERLLAKIDRATRIVPRLRERVVSNPYSMAPPRWEADPDFDLAFHVRQARVPGDGSMRALLDMVQPMAMQGFDRDRPLWELLVADGLEEGRAAMVMKLHYSLSDGVGLVRMTRSMVERTREPEPDSDLDPMPDAPPVHLMSQAERFLDALDHERRKQADRVKRTWNALGESLAGVARDPVGAARDLTGALASVGRLLRPVSEPASPLMRGRSSRWRFDALRVPLAPTKAAARKAGGTLNDAFVAMVTGGLRLYHEALGANAKELRMSMPINLQSSETKTKAGNQFVPVRFLVPLDIPDPIARMREIRDRVQKQRNEPALPIVEEISSVLNRFPTAVTTTAFGAMLKGVDFVTSNVPGPPSEVYLSGARIEQIYGFGPLSGAAANITLFSYKGDLGIAVNTDRAAVPDPERLVECLEQGVAEVLAVA